MYLFIIIIFWFYFSTPETEYVNQRESMLCDMMNPNYEDPEVVDSHGITNGNGRHSYDDEDGDHDDDNEDDGYCEVLSGKPTGPEYLNTASCTLPRFLCANLDNPDYQEAFLPLDVPHSLFLPAAENLEYLGLNTKVQTPAL